VSPAVAVCRLPSRPSLQYHLLPALPRGPWDSIFLYSSLYPTSHCLPTSPTTYSRRAPYPGPLSEQRPEIHREICHFNTSLKDGNNLAGSHHGSSRLPHQDQARVLLPSGRTASLLPPNLKRSIEPWITSSRVANFMLADHVRWAQCAPERTLGPDRIAAVMQ
jgi:hypothetical protein